MVDKVVPQDEGTDSNLSESDADYADAAHIAAIGHAANHSDYVVSGFTLNTDFTNNEVSISQGQARILVTDLNSVNHGDGTTTWLEATQVVRKDSATLSLQSGENHVYVRFQQSQPDSADFVITGGTAPSGESLKIGLIDASANTTEHLNREPDATMHDLTVNGVADIFKAAIDKLSATIDGNQQGITNLANIEADQGQVSTEPSANEDIARKADLDGKADAGGDGGHATTHQAGGSDELDLTDLTGETDTPQPAKEHNNDAHSEDFLSPTSADTVLDAVTLGKARAYATASEDLSTLTFSSSDDGGLFYHNGADDVPLVGGGSSNSRGYYRYSHANTAFYRVGTEADLLDGYEASDFLLKQGDTATGPIVIRTENQNALLSLINEDPNDFPEIKFGPDQTEGAKIRYYSGDEEIWFGRYTDSGGFQKDYGIDLENGNAGSSL